MKLTLQTDYALRILLYLANQGDTYVRLRDISDAYQVSHNHLIKVVQNIHQHGFVVTKPGRSGGMKLARLPQAISIGEVVSAVEPDLSLVECMSDGSECVIAPMCQIKHAMWRARQAFFEVLNATTLADVMLPSNAFRHLLEAHEPLQEAPTPQASL